MGWGALMLVGIKGWMRGLVAQSPVFVGLAVVGFFWRLFFDCLHCSSRSRPASATFCFGLRFRTLWLFLSSHQAQLVYRFIVLFLFRPFHSLVTPASAPRLLFSLRFDRFYTRLEELRTVPFLRSLLIPCTLSTVRSILFRN